MEEFLMHYGVKGMRWKKHKYQAIKNGRYTYPNNMSNTLATGKTDLGKSREKRDAIVSDAAEKKNSVNVASLKEKQEVSKLDAQLRALRESNRFKWTDIANDKGLSLEEKALKLLRNYGIQADVKTKSRIALLARDGKLDWLNSNPAVRDAYNQRKKEANRDKFGAGPNTLPNKNAKVGNSLNNDNFVSRGLSELNKAKKNKKFFKKKGW